jgi:hypothetical protein
MNLLSSLIELCKRAIAYLIYLLFRLFLGVGLRFTGYKRMSVGTCTIVAPVQKMSTILEGIELLRVLDPAMFQRLTAERPYVFLYNNTFRYQQMVEYSMISDRFLRWGKEGVAIFCVQCILDRSLLWLPKSRDLLWGPEKTLEARSEIQRQLFEWVKQRPFPPQLVTHYEGLAKQPLRSTFSDAE